MHGYEGRWLLRGFVVLVIASKHVSCLLGSILILDLFFLFCCVPRCGEIFIADLKKSVFAYYSFHIVFNKCFCFVFVLFLAFFCHSSFLFIFYFFMFFLGGEPHHTMILLTSL